MVFLFGFGFSFFICVSRYSLRLFWFGFLSFCGGFSWEGDDVPTSRHDVSAIDLRSEESYTTYVKPDTFHAGSRIKLPMNGKLVFSSGNDPVLFQFK